MRILQIVHGYPPEFVAGTELYVQALSRGLVGAGHRCFVLAGTSRTDASPGLLTVEQDGVPVTRFVSTSPRIGHWAEYYNPEAEALVRGYLEMLRPDIVHLHHWLHLTGNLVAICKELKLPVIVTLHDLWTTCARIHRVLKGEVFCHERPSPVVCTPCVPRDPWQSDEEVAREVSLRQEQLTQELELADRLIAPSLAHKALLQTMWDLPDHRIHVLPHGSISGLAPPASSDAPGSPERPLQIGHWGYLTPEKGVHVLLEAIHHLRDPSAVEVHLFGIAEGPEYQQRLQGLARGLSVTFHGPYRPADLAKLELDIAAFPSFYHESYSFVLDEAFQLGLPVIVSDRGAMPDRIGEAGLTFPAGDAAALARWIQSLLDDPGLMMKLKEARPGPIVSMEEHIAMLSEHYGQVLSSPEPKPIPPSDDLKRLAHKHRAVSESDVLILKLQREQEELQREQEERLAEKDAIIASLQDFERKVKGTWAYRAYKGFKNLWVRTFRWREL